MKKTINSTIALAALCCFIAPPSASAAGFPAKGKTITLIVPFAAGGPTDRVARDLAEALRKPLGGNNVVVVNVTGAGSSIGTAKAMRANPDGYTLLFHQSSAMSTMPTLYQKLPFKIPDDFTFLGMINEVPMSLIGRPNMPASNFQELKALIEKSNGQITYGNAGIGTATHMCGLLLQDALNLKMRSVPYKGAAPAIADLLGDQIDLVCDQTTSTTSYIEGGRVKAFGVTTATRLNTPALKNLPTLDEVGVKGFNLTIWHGLYGPKGMSANVAKKLNEALKAALNDPVFLKKQDELGALVVTDKRLDPAEHKKSLEAEIVKMGPVLAATGATVN